MPAFSVNQVALGVGAGGTLVDVSDFVKGTEGVTYAYGRQDEFRDPSPGVITFTLENQDGRFTPGNASSPLATLLSEGTAACWNLGGRLVEGQVTAVGFAASEDQWGRISVTCGDVFHAANRTAVTDLSHDMASASAYLFWPLDDDPTSVVAVEANGGPSLQPDVLFPSLVTFGATSTTPSPDTQVTLTNATTELEYFGTGGATGPASFPTINYPAGSLGFWGFWATPFTGQGAQLNVAVAAGWQTSLSFSPSRVAVVCIAGTGTNVNVGVNWEVGSAHYIAFSLTYVGTLYTLSLFIDGVLAGSSTLTWSPFVGPTNADFQPDSVRFQVGDGVSIQSVGLSHLSHSSVLVHEEAAGVTTEAARVTALASLVPGMTIGSLDANLSTAPVAGSVTNAWSGLCDVLRTEQGHLYAVTSGSLLAPATVVNMRARTRPETPSATFDAQTDLSGLPQFIRDVTNMFATITATGPDDSASVTDVTVIPRVGSASSSETVLLEDQSDLLGYAQDRMLRGKNVALRAAQVTIDTLTTSAATQAAVLGLTPGDRVRISNLPSAQLGFTSWDGWFLGASEVHAPGPSAVDVFTLYLAPVLPRTAVFDTDEFMAGGELTLTSPLSVTGGATLRTNYCTNPTFETGITGWSALLSATLAQSTVKAHSGTHSLAVTTPGAAAGEGTHSSSAAISGATSGSKISASAWVFFPAGATGIFTIGSTGTGAANVTSSFTGTGAWQEVTVSGGTMGTALNAFALIRTGGTAQAITFYADDVCVEIATTAGDPFTGDTPDTITLLYSWTGTAGASTSIQQTAVWATAMSVTSGDGSTWLERVAVPYTLELDTEQVTVTAAAAPSGGTQTATITRGVNGTTPATHAAGIPVDLAVPALFAF